jgi:endonuclease-3
MLLKDRYTAILDYFSQHNPQAETELVYTNPFELLVAVILSAQCTDKRVNLTTPALFEKYPDALSMTQAGAEDIFPFIKSISYPNNKAKHLAGMAKMLVSDFKGVVPSDTELLQKLPGVGRKTANVIASCIFNLPKMAVDTHVMRVSTRLGLVRGLKGPLQIEKQLVKHIPENQIRRAHHWLILHGRYTCLARNPKCAACGIKEWCVYYEKKVKKEKSKAENNN